ncbi:MAG: acetyl-CoA carboxylase biotin carboxyl carrier protein [Acidobacteria bacterium]|nr:acetyl-CoA carboxylase biotin carboxyl carrier protein [Acidobacteriota bacterium]
MFKFEEICELIQLVGSTGISSIEIERSGSKLRIEGVPRPMVMEGTTVMASQPTVPVMAMSQQPGSAAVSPVAMSPDAVPAAQSGGGEELEDESLHFVTSPIVGTFYRAPNPDAEPYVKVGDFVEKGQVLCIVEAMKLMNEIESDLSGTIVKVYPENAQPVEFGERLFAIKPA